MEFAKRLKFKIFALVIAPMFFSAVFVSSVNAATFAMSPASKTFEKNCLQKVDILVDASSQSSNSGEVTITYDPAQIDIVDSDAGRAGIQIKIGNAYESYIYNSVNTSTGTIRLAGASFIDYLESQLIFGTIEFLPKSSATSSQFILDFDGVGATLDSNIADSTTSNDLLTGVTNGSYSFNGSACGNDTQAPQIDFVSPTNNQSNVAANANVTINITDNKSGIDLNSLNFLINGVLYKVTDDEVSFTGNDLNYTFVINPTGQFPTNEPSTVVVFGKDKSNNAFSGQIIFNLPTVPENPTDTKSPIIKFIDPINMQLSVPVNKVITMEVTDDSSGVDLASIRVTLNGKTYKAGDSVLDITGTPLEYKIKFTQPNIVLVTELNYLRVIGEDVAGNTFDSQIIFNKPLATGGGECTENPPTNPGNGGGSETENCLGETVEFTEVTKVINNFLSNTSKSFDGTVLAPVVKEVGIAGLLGILSIGFVALNLFRFLAFVTTPSLIFSFFGVLLGKERDKPWGVVVDATNSKPIAFAACRLYLKGSQYSISQTITDLEGRYGFIVTPGEYRLEVKGSDYKTFIKDFVIDDLSSINGDVKLVPRTSDAEYKESNADNITRFIKRLYIETSKFIFILGFVLSILAVFITPVLFNFVILTVYFIILVFTLMPGLSKKKKYAAVVDSQNNLRLPFAQVKIFNPETWELVDSVTTNYNGQFDFYGKPGKYAILVIASGYKFPSIKDADKVIKSKFNSMIEVTLKKGKNSLMIFVDPVGDSSGNMPSPFS